MYNLVFLPLAQRDMTEIVSYISHVLHNPQAAQALADDFIAEAEKLASFPYAMPVYVPLRPLKLEYRTVLVHNYLIFYIVNEPLKQITVFRVIHAKRDYGKLLE